MAIEQLGGTAVSGTPYVKLATALDNLLKGNPTVDHFYFLFDNADKNQAAINYLFSPDNIIENTALQRILKNWELVDKLQLKIVMAARHPVQPNPIYPSFSSVTQIKLDPLDRHSVQTMLEKLIRGKRIPVPFRLVSELSDEVYYLTGGHPKCAKQMLVALVERGCVRPTKKEWEQLYSEHVISTIHAEMLKPIDLELLSTIWNLSTFRRFDQRLLGSLLDRGILPSVPGDKSRQARDLRAKLAKINLFDVEENTSTIATNYSMRHALSLNMRLDAPDRYKTLNLLALEIFLDRLHSSETGSEKKIERTAVNLFEILYHWIKLLEVGPAEKKSRSRSTPVWTRIRDAFESYLLLALSTVPIEGQSDFLRFLKTRWAEDKELQEAIRRVTGREDCFQKLAQMLDKHDTIQNDAH
jgi:hypothetical protein